MELCELLAAHALLGDEQDACGDYEDATDDVEDRGTDTTSAGKDAPDTHNGLYRRHVYASISLSTRLLSSWIR